MTGLSSARTASVSLSSLPAVTVIPSLLTHPPSVQQEQSVTTSAGACPLAVTVTPVPRTQTLSVGRASSALPATVCPRSVTAIPWPRILTPSVRGLMSAR